VPIGPISHKTKLQIQCIVIIIKLLSFFEWTCKETKVCASVNYQLHPWKPLCQSFLKPPSVIWIPTFPTQRFVDRHMLCGRTDLDGELKAAKVEWWGRVDDIGTDEVQSNSRRPNRTVMLLQQWTSTFSHLIILLSFAAIGHKQLTAVMCIFEPQQKSNTNNRYVLNLQYSTQKRTEYSLKTNFCAVSQEMS